MNINEAVAKLKVVPVVKIDNVEDAKPLAEALIAGGLPIAEVTFRTAAAYEAIKAMAEIPEMIVGAGTVINVEQAKMAIEAGAKFIVSPGFSAKVVAYAQENNIPIFPGVCTPSEVMACLEFGLEVVKFFPAENYGGLSTVNALGGPFPQLKFMPTGGIGPKNIKEYLANSKIIACGGSWMVKDTMIQAKQFDEITKLTAEAMALVNE
ncbi:bifunctional 4-hydroxy-2-oxoglutarate aldolase/2-dehydro-3-deoxy-phosphogluconate aldolase [Chakrabartyella piscis]|uniref:bifunctional 4-hydroxy-2-oxoglutarate aldolase/2-dehydro-3-deoxy-phosphogluconate aldolase n=1 Tax=Chakrabartyella piscis TaxID=2918914 RepID=UPI00295890EA|nr:bifunctional 4-hydroxy-2-oxoglutarate aldolase/2-dehydro-3-deoxy-phosphogluconate aldolase [Chakrabartyella piscis]